MKEMGKGLLGQCTESKFWLVLLLLFWFSLEGHQAGDFCLVSWF